MIGVIGPDQLQRAVSWKQAVNSVRAALLGLAAGSVVQPPVVEMRFPHNGVLHVKCGHLVDSRWIVIKAATGEFPDGPPTGCLLLVDAATGAPRWVLDDRGWLTQQRTAAAGALATLMFSGPESTRALVCGTGELARALIAAHAEVAPHLTLTLWGRNPDRTRALADECGLEAALDLPLALQSTDVVITATNSHTPLCDSRWIRPGTHITALGADTVGKQELPTALLDRADLIVCDDLATARQAGELQHASEATASRARSWPDIAANGIAERSRQAITIADLCGIGAEDAALAEAAVAGLATEYIASLGRNAR